MILDDKRDDFKKKTERKAKISKVVDEIVADRNNIYTRKKLSIEPNSENEMILDDKRDDFKKKTERKAKISKVVDEIVADKNKIYTKKK